MCRFDLILMGFLAWMIFVAAFPKAISGTMRVIARSDSLAARLELCLQWFLVVLSTAWILWGQGLPFRCFCAAIIVPLGFSALYFVWQMDQIENEIREPTLRTVE